jgi:hypothetical protein
MHLSIQDHNPIIKIKGSNMKKLLILPLLIIIGISVSSAQLGIKAGLNIATAGGDDKALNPSFFDAALTNLPNMEPKSRTGVTAGITYSLGLPVITIQLEALYTEKGAVYETTLPQAYGGGTGKGTFKLAYFDIPAVIRFYPLHLPVAKPYIEGGVQYSILSSAKFNKESPAGSETGDVKNDITKNDFSILIGIGTEITVLDINIRYVIGQTKVLKNYDNKLYNRGIMLTAGLKF